MWSTLPYANTFMCTPAQGGRAGHLGDRAPVRVRLYGTPLPEAPRPCRGPVNHHAGARPALPRANRAPRSACVAPPRPRWAAAPRIATAHPGEPLRCGGLRVPAGAGAPAPPPVRHAAEPRAPGAGRRGQVRSGTPPTARPRRSHAGGPPPRAGGVAAGHTVDHQARSGVGPKKQRRAQRSPRPRAPPTWALGLGAAGGWSRLAQPDHQGWPDAAAPPQGPALRLPPDAPTPQALACEGRRRRPGRRPADQRWRRCVTGRPVRAVTIAWLAWGAAPRAAHGCTALWLSGDNAAGHRRRAVQPWRRHPNQQGQRGGAGGRRVVCPWPRTSPWRNPLEPQWGQGQRADALAARG
jgi:hypothetical protein